MKKTVVLVVMLFVGLQFGFAQHISDHAIGLRLGQNDGLGTEISYQHGFSDKNRLEVDLGMRSSNAFSAFKLVGVYQWIWELGNNFNWYAGAGAGLGSWRSKAYDNSTGTFFFAAGDIGIEYNFDFPLQISLDARPEIGSNTYYANNLGFDIALGVRYKF